MRVSVEPKDAEKKALQVIEGRMADWYDLVSFGEAFIKSRQIKQLGEVQVYVLKGHVDVEFESGWRSSAREHSRSGRVAFEVILNAEDGKILSVKHGEEKE